MLQAIIYFSFLYLVLWPEFTNAILDMYLHRMKKILIVKNNGLVKKLAQSSFNLILWNHFKVSQSWKRISDKSEWQAAVEYLGICYIPIPTHWLNEKLNKLLFIDFFASYKLMAESVMRSCRYNKIISETSPWIVITVMNC